MGGTAGREQCVGSRHEGDAQLVKPEPAAEEDDGENADKEDEGAAGHLVDGDGGVEEADIHELRERDNAVRRRRRRARRGCRGLGSRNPNGRALMSAKRQAGEGTYRGAGEVTGGREPQQQYLPPAEMLGRGLELDTVCGLLVVAVSGKLHGRAGAPGREPGVDDREEAWCEAADELGGTGRQRRAHTEHLSDWDGDGLSACMWKGSGRG